MSEAFVTKYIENMPVSEGVAFDIGANHGRYTIALANKFSHVYAFEPHPENIVKLKETIKDKIQELRNPFTPNITIVKSAIADTTKRGKMFPSRSNAGGHSISVVVANQQKWGHCPDNNIEVNFITIDDFVEAENITNLEFMKIDIEGAEDFIFKGAQKTLKNNQLDIMLETHQTINTGRLYDTFRMLDYKWYDSELREVPAIAKDKHYLVSNSDREVEW